MTKWILIGVLISIILCCLSWCLVYFLFPLPPDLDTYGLWCSLKCRGDEGCLKECMVDRPEWWK